MHIDPINCNDDPFFSSCLHSELDLVCSKLFFFKATRKWFLWLLAMIFWQDKAGQNCLRNMISIQRLEDFLTFLEECVLLVVESFAISK